MTGGARAAHKAPTNAHKRADVANKGPRAGARAPAPRAPRSAPASRAAPPRGRARAAARGRRDEPAAKLARGQPALDGGRKTVWTAQSGVHRTADDGRRRRRRARAMQRTPCGRQQPGHDARRPRGAPWGLTSRQQARAAARTLPRLPTRRSIAPRRVAAAHPARHLCSTAQRVAASRAARVASGT